MKAITNHALLRLLLPVILIGLLTGCLSQQAPEPPTISDPRISAPTPQEPREEIGISIDVSSAIGVSVAYEWKADGGEIVRGQGSPAITYRTPEEPGIYNVRVTVSWDNSSVEKITTIRVEAPASGPPTDAPAPGTSDTPAPTHTLELSMPEPTNTPVPPTDTPTPKPTNTPAPTNTPRPTPVPTATIDADPTVYDNFNNPAFDGGVQTGLWETSVSPPSWIEQQNGVVVFTLVPGAGDIASLYPVKRRNLPSDQFNFVEAKLLLSSENIGQDGDISVALATTLNNGQNLIYSCLIYRRTPVQVGCEVFGRGNQAEYLSDKIPTNYDVWHTVHIDLDPEMVVTFYVDGQQVGSYSVADAEELKSTAIRPQLEVWSPKQDGIKAYFDDVRIGQVEQ